MSKQVITIKAQTFIITSNMSKDPLYVGYDLRHIDEVNGSCHCGSYPTQEEALTAIKEHLEIQIRGTIPGSIITNFA